MRDDKIRVTVDGEPVSAEMNWEQVRAYLMTKGWARADVSTATLDGWRLTNAPAEYPTIWIGRGGDSIGGAVEKLARSERRRPSAVLRDIARVAAAVVTAEPLSDEEFVRLEGVLRQVSKHGMPTPVPTMFRLLATVRAREAERDEYARRLSVALDDHLDTLRKEVVRSKI